MNLVILPYYSRAFGSQVGVFKRSFLVERGLEDHDRIVAHLDAVPPSRVSRFGSREEAEVYLERRGADVLVGARQ